MSYTFTDLAFKLQKLSASLEKKASDNAVEVALAIVDDLTTVTPVDTSKAESNWVVSLGTPATQEIEAHVPGYFGWTAAESRRIAQANARKVLQNKRPGVKVFVSNLTNYIEQLNEGSSRQEPAGFVERAVLIGRLKAKSLNRKKG